jgi:hypothetical protein
MTPRHAPTYNNITADKKAGSSKRKTPHHEAASYDFDPDWGLEQEKKVSRKTPKHSPNYDIGFRKTPRHRTNYDSGSRKTPKHKTNYDNGPRKTPRHTTNYDNGPSTSETTNPKPVYSFVVTMSPSSGDASNQEPSYHLKACSPNNLEASPDPEPATSKGQGKCGFVLKINCRFF